MHRLLLVLILPLFLDACASFQAYEQTHAIPAGSKLVLVRPLVIPSGTAHVYLQGVGRGAAGTHSVNQYETFCGVMVSSTSGGTIEPGTFTVTRYYQQAETIGLSLQKPTIVPVAARGGFVGIGGGNAGGTAPLFFAATMDLHSDQQPNVRKLVCGAWAMPWDGQYPTVAEIQRAVEPYFQIERAGGG